MFWSFIAGMAAACGLYVLWSLWYGRRWRATLREVKRLQRQADELRETAVMWREAGELVEAGAYLDAAEAKLAEARKV